MKKQTTTSVTRAILVIAFSSTVPACADEIYEYTIVDHDAGTSGGGTQPDAGAEEDADGGPSIDGGDSGCDLACEGECLPLKAAEFFGPFLIWIGPDEAQAPPCPPQAPVEQFKWHGDFKVEPATCGSCSCSPSYGSCQLPTTITAHAAPCNQADGAQETPTDPPAVWDGMCTTDNPIPAGLSCDGKPCVQSITSSPMVITYEACVSEPSSTASIPAPTWGLFARVCQGEMKGTCSPAEECVPFAKKRFRQCIERPGIYDCPEGEYTEPFILYEDFADDRACSDCLCGAPEGSLCQASITFHADNTCSSFVTGGGIWSEGPSCHDVTPYGQAIASKVATEPVYYPGICKASGGELSGEAAPVGARTVCCRP